MSLAFIDDSGRGGDSPYYILVGCSRRRSQATVLQDERGGRSTFMHCMANLRPSSKSRRSPYSEGNCRGERWHWCSNGPRFTAKNLDWTGNGPVWGPRYNPSPHSTRSRYEISPHP